VCRNENIDESNADLARDLRLLVRERLTAGDSDAQVMAYVTDRYGEYVLLRPDARGANLVLWLAGPAALLLAGGVAFAYARGRGRTETAVLSDEEEARLSHLMDDRSV
jgi:cytochrome c-type biogenesis protein CcmH